MDMTSNTLERLYEIAFQRILTNMGSGIPNEKLDYFLESFCKVFEIDYTSMSIIKNMYTKRLTPNKREVAIFSKVLNIPIVNLPIDYRTYRKYIKQWKISGSVELQPHIINSYLKPVIKLFVDKYISLMYNDISFIKYLKDIDLKKGAEHEDDN
jgi:hypothetical protein